MVGRRKLDATIDDLIRTNRLTYSDLADVLRRHARRGRDGCGKLRAVLDERTGSPTVPLSEWGRQAAELLETAGLPRPELEHRVHRSDGAFLAQLDLAYPELKIGIELDSVRFHLNRESFEHDPERRNTLEVEGWMVLNFTWRFGHDRPGRLCAMVRQAREVAIRRRSHPHPKFGHQG